MDKSTIRQVLVEWKQEQQKYKTWIEIAKAAGIKLNTFERYVKKIKPSLPCEDSRKKLFTLTNLDYFKNPIKEKKKKVRLTQVQPVIAKTPADKLQKVSCIRDLLFGIKRINDHMTSISELTKDIALLDQIVSNLDLSFCSYCPKKTIPTSQLQSSTQNRATTIANILEQLAEELTYFREGSEADRKTLANAIPGSNIAYLNSLLSALMSEDSFNRWKTMTTSSFYRFKKQKED